MGAPRIQGLLGDSQSRGQNKNLSLICPFQSPRAPTTVFPGFSLKPTKECITIPVDRLNRHVLAAENTPHVLGRRQLAVIWQRDDLLSFDAYRRSVFAIVDYPGDFDSPAKFFEHVGKNPSGK